MANLCLMIEKMISALVATILLQFKKYSKNSKSQLKIRDTFNHIQIGIYIPTIISNYGDFHVLSLY